MNLHPSSVNTPTCFVLESPPSHSWCTDNRLWCILSTWRALILSCPNRGSRIDPSDVAAIISPNARVSGTRQVDGHARRLRLFVPERSPRESISQ